MLHVNGPLPLKAHTIHCVFSALNSMKGTVETKCVICAKWHIRATVVYARNG